MDVRSIIALLMGLVIQLSQVQLRAASSSPESCGSVSKQMSCCDGIQTCPCAQKSEPKEKPVPLLPARVDLKLLVSKSAEPDSPEDSIVSPASNISLSASRPEPKLGYAGVPLAVAFCSFVI